MEDQHRFIKNFDKESQHRFIENFDKEYQELLNNKNQSDEYGYLALVAYILEKGEYRNNRTGIKTYSIFPGTQLSFNLKNNTFPLLTTKKVSLSNIAHELFWFLSGSTDNEKLNEKGVHIWDLNCDKEFLKNNNIQNREINDIGPGYGFQWRHFGAQYTNCKDNYEGKGIDQIKKIIQTLKTNPNDRRIILSSWNPVDVDNTNLPPCHCFLQFYVNQNKELSAHLYQRSGDLGLGVPYNIASYSLLIYLIAHCTDLTPGHFYLTIGDCHIYENHVNNLLIQLKRKPKVFPKLFINSSSKNIDDIIFENIELQNYNPYKNITLKMAV